MQFLTDKELSAVENLTREAGATLLSFWRSGESSGGHLTITAKPDGSNVTNADIASNEMLVTGLRGLFPGDRILSEEITPEADIDSAERVWIIDPLDGTQSFIEGRDDFAVLLSLAVNRRAVFGICYMPARDHFCITNTECSTTLNGIGIRCSPERQPKSECVYVRGCSIADPSLKFPRYIDSCLGFAKIAQGDFDGAIIRLKRLKQWDLAAPAALILGAGGKVTDENGEEIQFTAHNFNTHYFVASNGHCHEELLKQIVE